MTESNAVAGFLPSVNGLHFANRWEPGPTVRLGILDPRLVLIAAHPCHRGESPAFCDTPQRVDYGVGR